VMLCVVVCCCVLLCVVVCCCVLLCVVVCCELCVCERSLCSVTIVEGVVQVCSRDSMGSAIRKEGRENSRVSPLL